MPHDDVTRALAVMVYNKKIREFLEENDPKALEQAKRALEGVGFKLPTWDVSSSRSSNDSFIATSL